MNAAELSSRATGTQGCLYGELGTVRLSFINYSKGAAENG